MIALLPRISALAAAAVLLIHGAAAQESQPGAAPPVDPSMPGQEEMLGVHQHGATAPDGQGHGPVGSMMQGCRQHGAGMHSHNHMQAMMGRCGPAAGMHEQQERALVEPNLTGQDAFGAIQEIVHILEADPKTDWSKVNLEAVRQHLIDMNEVTLKADAVAKPIDGGIEVAITGSGRTVEAIQRMVPAHAQMIEESRLDGWSAKTEPLQDGVVLTVRAADPKEVQHIRGLGFIGIMASGHHHRLSHLAMARGERGH